MSTIDTSTWSPDSSLNTDIGGIPLNADASIQQTWQAIQMLMAALKGDTAAIELTINQPDGTTIVATNQTLTVVDNGHAHTIANVAGLQTALNGKASNASMTGATASADGASGLVPKPEAGDQDKVLKGDGTWGTVDAGDVSVAWEDIEDKPSTFPPSSHSHGNLANDGKLPTASRVVVTDGSKAISVSSITTMKLGYLTDVTANIQGQIDGKADKATTLSSYGITDAYTKTEIDSKLTSAMHYKGSVATVADLPSSGNQTGDFYNVTATGENYAWTGSAWDATGSIVDLAAITNSEIDTVVAS